MQDDEDDSTNILGFNDMDDYQTITEIEKQIESLQYTSEEIVEVINLSGLSDILDISRYVVQLIKSSKSIEEINNELEKIYLNDKPEAT